MDIKAQLYHSLCAQPQPSCFSLLSVVNNTATLVSCGCCNKWWQIQWLETTGMCYLKFWSPEFWNEDMDWSACSWRLSGGSLTCYCQLWWWLDVPVARLQKILASIHSSLPSTCRKHPKITTCPLLYLFPLIRQHPKVVEDWCGYLRGYSSAHPSNYELWEKDIV